MLTTLINVGYLLTLVALFPWIVFKSIRTGKYRAGWGQKFLGLVPRRDSERPCVWFHAVSVGEVLLLRRVVAQLAERRPALEIVISTTTNTGLEVARQHFGAFRTFYFPLDFSWAVSRALGQIRPDVVVLAELELWPNFIRAARRFGARVAVINGRMSPNSHRGYRRVRPLMKRLLGRIDQIAVQNAEYANRFKDIGAPADRVVVTGSLKYDGVQTSRQNPETDRLRELLGITGEQLVWVAGSTSDPEEKVVLDCFERLRQKHSKLRLVLVPRHKERFDEVAKLITAAGHELVRRSMLPQGSDPASGKPGGVILMDSLGELSAVWGLADIAFVGGSFAPRGGQNMIEPAGYGAAVTFGPGVWNFQDTVNQLLNCGGAIQVASAAELEQVTHDLAADANRRAALGNQAQQFVSSQHGATAKTVKLLEDLLTAETRKARKAA